MKYQKITIDKNSNIKGDDVLLILLHTKGMLKEISIKLDAIPLCG